MKIILLLFIIFLLGNVEAGGFFTFCRAVFQWDREIRRERKDLGRYFKAREAEEKREKLKQNPRKVFRLVDANHKYAPYIINCCIGPPISEIEEKLVDATLDWDEAVFRGREIEGPRFPDRNFQANHFGFVDDEKFLITNIGDHVGYRYEVVKHLNRNSQRDVFEAWDHESEQFVLIKQYRYGEKPTNEVHVSQVLDRCDLLRRHRTNRSLRHFEFRGHYVTVFPSYKLNLQQYIDHGRFNSEFLRLVSLRILDSLEFMHRLHMIHCNLNPSNILLKGGDNIAISDFENTYMYPASVEEQPSSREHQIQDWRYRAPESEFGVKWDSAADIWSFGVILYELLYGRGLFSDLTEPEQYPMALRTLFGHPADSEGESRALYSHVDPNIPVLDYIPTLTMETRFSISYSKFELPQTLFDNYNDIILSCLQYLPSGRPTAKQLHDKIQSFPAKY